MKNLLPILNNILEERPKRTTKEEKIQRNKKYHRSWYGYIGKIAKVNLENLLGISQQEIVAKYLHTLPEEYRDIPHLYSYLDIENITKDGVFIDPIYSSRRDSISWWNNRTYYYFDPETNLLSVKRKVIKKKKKGTKEERLKEFYEKKRAKNKSNREFNQKKEELYSELLHKIVKKRKDKEEKINLQKIVSHGFDPKTSFRPEYKTNNK